MRVSWRRGWRCTVVSPRCKTGLCGFAAGAGISLLLVAAPLWLVGGDGGRGEAASGAGVTPLVALSTTPAESPQFDISNLMVGEWVGEMCPDDGIPVAIRFEFSHEADEVAYSLVGVGAIQSEGILGSGTCDVDGEEVSFHAFLAILSSCDEACGVDRLYEGHFDHGSLVGRYADEVVDEACRSCVGGGTWWLEPEIDG